MYQALIVIHVIIAASLVGLVLIQHGKGADAGAAFGSGSSSTVFGARGSSSFLTRMTAFLAAAFFVTSFGLGYLTLQLGKGDDSGIKDTVIEQPAVVTPSSDIPDVPAATTTSPVDSDIPVIPEGKAPSALEPAADSETNKIPE